ncbi:MAG: hypothetical protein VR77_08520 [Flavobacteriales bacterium BRH_c54]|nr:MAG: hypothetical protein VR77_08520 [Flavobacteriales bacterium BRH_c54]
MKNLKNITCPNCHSSFEIKSAIWNDIKSSIELELNQEILNQKSELQKKKDEYQKLSFRLSKEKADFHNLVEQQVAKDILVKTDSLRKKIEEEISSKKEKELDELQSKLISKTQEISGLNKLKRKMALENEEKEAKIIIKYDSMLEEKLKEAKLAVQNESSEKHKLEIMQKEKLISDLKTQLDITQRKIEQNSSQLIGEVQEIRLESLLYEIHGDTDNIVPIPKGVNGADCYQEVKTDSGVILGKILYESKFTKSFSKGWLDKLHEDNKSINSQILVLVTKTMPKELENESFGIIDGIFITRLNFIKPLSILLKYSILKVSQVQLKYKGHENKQKVLFDYITSQEFENMSKSVLKQLESLKISMDVEKKKLVKIYAEREKMIENAIMSMTQYFGNINGIVSSDAQVLKALPKAS